MNMDERAFNAHRWNIAYFRKTQDAGRLITRIASEDNLHVHFIAGMHGWQVVEVEAVLRAGAQRLDFSYTEWTPEFADAFAVLESSGTMDGVTIVNTSANERELEAAWRRLAAQGSEAA